MAGEEAGEEAASTAVAELLLERDARVRLATWRSGMMDDFVQREKREKEAMYAADSVGITCRAVCRKIW